VTAPLSPLSQFLSKVTDLTVRGEGAWASRCPAHADETPSLYIVEKGRGFLVKCSAGCRPVDIVQAVGMTREDLTGRKPKKVDLRLDTPGATPTFFDYFNERGELEFQKMRIDKDGVKNFTIRRKVKGEWKDGMGTAREIPFRLPQLLATASVIVVEGEKAVQRLESERYVATCLPHGASSKWHPEYADYFRGKRVVILPDHDLAGRNHAKMLASELAQVDVEVRVVELPGLKEGEDVYDWFARGGTRDALDTLLRAGDAVTRETAITRFPLTEDGNAQRFIRFHGEDVRYRPGKKEWLYWDGVRWQPDDTDTVIHGKARDILRRLEIESETAQPGDEMAAYQRHIRGTAKASGLAAILTLARKDPKVAIAESELDRRERTAYHLAVENGVIDLRTGQLLDAPQRDLLITRAIGCRFNPSARAPRWERFVSEVRGGNLDEIDFFHRWLGYGLIGDSSEQKMVICYGQGSNGKGKLLNTIRNAMGSYAAVTPSETFIEQRGRSGPRDDLERLEKVRMVVSSESSDGVFLDEAIIKLVTGEDAVAARPLFGKYKEYFPQFKISFFTNHKPRVRGTDHGIWRRLIFVPFTQTFPVCNQLDFELAQEREGILAWLVRGALAWQKHGLMIPESIQKATRDYRLEQDPIGGFLEDDCYTGEGYLTPEKPLFVAYRKWCEQNYEHPFQIRRFRGLLEERGFTRGSAGGGAIFRGVGLRAAERHLPRTEEPPTRPVRVSSAREVPYED